MVNSSKCLRNNFVLSWSLLQLTSSIFFTRLLHLIICMNPWLVTNFDPSWKEVMVWILRFIHCIRKCFGSLWFIFYWFMLWHAWKHSNLMWPLKVLTFLWCGILLERINTWTNFFFFVVLCSRNETPLSKSNPMCISLNLTSQLRMNLLVLVLNNL
jgi:hypothetical protein